VNWVPVADQVVRQVPLLVAIGGELYPSLPLEVLRIAEGQSTLLLRSAGATGLESIRIGATLVPTDANGQLWLRYSRSDSRRTIPAHRILSGEFDPSEVAGRHILIGASAPGLLDLRATPLDPAVPGVEIHAQALEQMLSGEHSTRPDFATGAELVFLAATGALVAWLICSSGPGLAAIIGVLSVAAVMAASWLAYAKGGLLLDPVYPALALVVLYSATTLFGYIESETDRSRVRAAFKHYMAPALVDELASRPGALKLGGENRDLTLLFADMRGFTQRAEGMAAEAVVSFINCVFTPISQAITSNRGTIDKFMGDAVMAYWNAPLADPEHAQNACRAALAILRQMELLNGRLAHEAQQSG
jgi:adenylate cyclase